MSMLTSYDHKGPLINPRKESLCVRNDPLGYRRHFVFEFDIDVFDALSTRSMFKASVGDQNIRKGNFFNDYYGFGTSRDAAIEEAEEFFKKIRNANIDVEVVTTLETRAAFFDDESEPFYHRAVRCFYVPENWYRRDDQESRLRHDEEFVIWKNGALTEEAAKLQDFIDKCREQDCAGERRNGTLT